MFSILADDLDDGGFGLGGGGFGEEGVEDGLEEGELGGVLAEEVEDGGEGVVAEVVGVGGLDDFDDGLDDKPTILLSRGPHHQPLQRPHRHHRHNLFIQILRQLIHHIYKVILIRIQLNNPYLNLFYIGLLVKMYEEFLNVIFEDGGVVFLDDILDVFESGELEFRDGGVEEGEEGVLEFG